MSQVQQVKEATDIIQIVGERLKLQRSGSSYKAPCPFHSEKTPSFFVSDQLQRYRCFGCSETGDALDFLQKYDAMSFGEALKYLADKAGIQLEEFQKTPEDDLRERLLAILNLAKEYYHYLLVTHNVGKEAREYLKDRKITKDSINLFNLGYSMSDWDGLVKYLHKKKKYPLEEIEQAGLVIRAKGGRYYDRFRGRVMFPLKDHRGRVVGFSGRLLDNNAKEAKYINTPETMLYHKSKMLFGYKELLNEIRKKEEVIVVEGEFDVVSSAQSHVNNIVAIKGSALTKEQVKLLARVSKKIILCLDADEAGAKATKRAIEVAGDTDIELRVIDLSGLDGGQKDVDELARHEPKLWREIEKQNISVYEFLLRLSLRHHDPEKPEGKREIMKDLGAIFGGIVHAVERDYYVQKLAETLRVKKEVIMQDINRIKDGVVVKKPKKKKKEEEKEEKELAPALTRQQSFERYCVFLIFETNKFQDKLEEFKEINFQTPGLTELVTYFLKSKTKGKVDLKKITYGLAEDLKELVFDIVYAPEFVNLKDQIDSEKEWKNTFSSLKKESARSSIKILQEQIQELDKKSPKTEKEEAKLADLLRKVAQFQRSLRVVRAVDKA
ncbi:MAG: DNA primase [Candidatus Pacebacteria bacterium]|jgi:DNA primase|nr:DNA primase [Candidatus Paceibacterota bacterium]MBT4652249.1 DNA primase [Candidatus Paceibacterota bacterium]MBT6756661.1 DNA primase [Candidatus Paceibacterota bacterium]MBT6921423.1 DNA primase [Candidatus Paceibacterota bacterium]